MSREEAQNMLKGFIPDEPPTSTKEYWEIIPKMGRAEIEDVLVDALQAIKHLIKDYKGNLIYDVGKYDSHVTVLHGQMRMSSQVRRTFADAGIV